MSGQDRPGTTPATGGDPRAYKAGGDAPDSDEELIVRIRAGERERFEMLVVRHERPLYGFVLGHRLDEDSAADVTQEAFLKAYRALDGFDRRRSSFKTWLYTIAYNLIRDLGRRRKVRTRELERMAQFQERAPREPGPEEQVASRDEVERLLSGLDDEARELLSMKFFHELGYEDMAQITGLNQATIRSKVHRALKRLKAGMGDVAAAGGGAS